MLCLALIAVLAAQAPVSAVDQAHHGVGLEHAAKPFAGAVVVDTDIDQRAATAALATEDDVGPVSHHHLTDGAHATLVAQGATLGVILSQNASAFSRAAHGHASALLAGRDRPPRPILHTIA